MSGAERAARFLRGVEHGVQRGVGALLPDAIARRIAPSLDGAAGGLRRVLATPVYLRQQIATWDGERDGAPVRVATWGKRDAPHLLFPLVFDGIDDDRAAPPRPTWRESRWLAPGGFVGLDADAWIVETTPVLAPRLRRAGFWIVPALVRYAAPVAAVAAAIARPGHSLRSDLRRIEVRRLTTRLIPYRAETSHAFYHRYLRPYLDHRFAERGEVTSFAEVDRAFASGVALAVERPGAGEPDAMAVLCERGATLFLAKLGVRDGDVALARDGTLAALYRGAFQHALARGLATIDTGRSLPWRGSPGARYKQKWALRPVGDPAQTLEYAVRPADPLGGVARRLAEEQVILREPAGLRALTLDGVRRLDERLPTPGRGR